MKFTAKETPEPPSKDAGPDALTPPPLAMLIAGIASALAIATLGIWYFRK